MKKLVRENTWSPFPSTCGWGNGYVIVNKKHPIFGMKGFEIESKFNINVHGGLTYSKIITKDTLKHYPELTEQDLDKWMVGFDTSHCDDNKLNWTKKRVEKETEKLFNQIKNIEHKTIMQKIILFLNKIFG